MKKLVVLTALMAVASAPALMAHNWGCYNQPSTSVTVNNDATQFGSETQAAIDEWNADTVIDITMVNSGADVNVFDENSGATGWGGLATINIQGCNITHCEAQLNTYYSWSSNGARGVQCQEVGHCWGLDHSNDGGCMGGGYYYAIENNYNVVQHNIDDMISKYGGGGGDPPSCGSSGASCSSNSDCCSNKCRNGSCKGNGLSTAPNKGAGHGADLVVEANWYNRPNDLNEALELSDAVVFAEVVNIFDGPDIVRSNYDAVPTQRVVFEVKRVLDGTVESTFELFHTGNDEFILSGDPPYELGERYVLFLTPRADGSHLVISPEGRYSVDGGVLDGHSARNLSKALSGLRVLGLARDIGERRANLR